MLKIFLSNLWLASLILSTFTSIKTFTFLGFEFTVAVIAYPLTYIFADIFTEVYGYKETRGIVWSGFTSLFLFSFFAYFYSIVVPSPDFQYNDAFNIVFRMSPFISLFLFFGYLAGEFSNSFVLAKMKIYYFGEHEEWRYVVSTVVGQLADNTIFWMGVAFFLNLVSMTNGIQIALTSVIFCVSVELFMLPITKRVIKKIKEAEGIDTYDHGTNFNPFKLG